ncbi:hypothetical protein KGF56_004313 [Candida oxycetoniae]|uniref:Uncharacterized protein n=1 Tax=Candida oxycetoniae TaxID=497107 RepID=A0AAI9STQ9_9ASCO|nr:uncharacterized protein KGF56_004313 [Candida oxycetoniae]KAI3402852.2 hypothetical protein KGF56_004313 [Candida oxycetoniae]
MGLCWGARQYNSVVYNTVIRPRAKLFHQEALRLFHQESLLAQKVNERVSVKLYEKLTKHGQTTVKLRPMIEYAPLYSKMLTSGMEFRISDSIRIKGSKESLLLLLETATFHILCVIECLQRKQHIPEVHRLFFDRVVTKLGKPLNGSSDLNSLAREFAIAVAPALEEGVQCFSAITSRLEKFQNIDDLTNWIKIITAKSLFSGFSLVKDDIPAFVMYYLITRSPFFKEDYLLQFDMWINNIEYIAMQKRHQVSAIKTVIEHLVRHSFVFEPACLIPLIKHTFQVFHSKRAGIQIKLGSSYFNDLIWSLAISSIRHQSVNPMHIADAQKLLMAYTNIASKQGQGQAQGQAQGQGANENLSYRAYLGISIVMSRISREKGEKIFEAAQTKFAKDSKSNRDMVAYYISLIWHSKTLEEAVKNFQIGVVKYEQSSKLWLAFVQKLKSLNAMTENGAIAIFRKIIASKANVTSDLVTELLHPISDFRNFQEIYNATQQVFKGKDYLFLVKYMQLLQDNPQAIYNFNFPWNSEISCLQKSFACSDQHLAHLNGSIFCKSIQLTSSYLKSIFKINPKLVFRAYYSEILEKGHIPNASCLGTLIDTAIDLHDRIVESEEPIQQTAIGEFQRNVKTSHESFGIFPSDALWVKYINLLAKHNYVSELSKIMKWWLDIKFEPKKHTLLQLLAVLPTDFAERHIRHHEQANSKKDWDWPSMVEFEKHIHNRRDTSAYRHTAPSSLH